MSTSTKAKPAGKTAADKQLEKDQEKLREANDKRGIARNVASPSTEVHHESDGVEVHALAGVCFIKTDGEVRLDQDGIFRLRKQLDRALQAVS